MSYDLELLRCPRQARGLTCFGFKLPASIGTLRIFADLHVPFWEPHIFGWPAHEQKGKRCCLMAALHIS